MTPNLELRTTIDKKEQLSAGAGRESTSLTVMLTVYSLEDRSPSYRRDVTLS
jgi:hypothetical protein